jgi:hypothetical protein
MSPRVLVEQLNEPRFDRPQRFHLAADMGEAPLNDLTAGRHACGPRSRDPQEVV